MGNGNGLWSFKSEVKSEMMVDGEMVKMKNENRKMVCGN